MEELLKRHRREQRDLQARVTQKKKNATKKTRKGINDECVELERQLIAKQQTEIVALGGGEVDEGADLDAEPEATANAEIDVAVNEVASKLNNTTLNSDSTDQNQVTKAKKPNRQKARLARRAAEQEAAAAKAEAEAVEMPDRRAQERAIMDREAAAHGLVEQEVRSDGHCMYAAVADQLSPGEQGDGIKPADYKTVRSTAASFISAHPNDFAPFLEEPLDVYVTKVRDTAEWGGHLELLALARAYGLCIKVLQGDGRVETIEASEGGAVKEKGKQIWLAYYRHSFGLGEHYNSLRKKG